MLTQVQFEREISVALNLQQTKNFLRLLLEISGSQTKRGVRGVPGKPGYFKMYFNNLRSDPSFFSFWNQSKKYLFLLEVSFSLKLIFLTVGKSMLNKHFWEFSFSFTRKLFEAFDVTAQKKLRQVLLYFGF